MIQFIRLHTDFNDSVYEKGVTSAVHRSHAFLLPPDHHDGAADRRHGDDAEFQDGHRGEVGAFRTEPGADHEAGEGLEEDGEVEVAGH